ncbi:MAG: hypothetical protein BTN85_1528 [Candidatus Methanohalarchaeum thermophilum]|uniref:Uncharacterized protein n=1 Tax=Methanohalarchaeum thermophilum TaxID=1903181 RepID=A0A1Q6DXI4_METT1|nr:MAG: hypothetical protein BTN85_1528 [Candidatus Methanohalarchaeum thermophilum]
MPYKLIHASPKSKTLEEVFPTTKNKEKIELQI